MVFYKGGWLKGMHEFHNLHHKDWCDSILKRDSRGGGVARGNHNKHTKKVPKKKNEHLIENIDDEGKF